jgi:methylase of polypeptide subunit release factors
MWALLRFLPSEDPPDIHIYNLNALLRDSDIAPVVGEEHLPPGTKERDGTKWKYVLGNPPYIRAERVKYGEEMRDLWKDVWGQNSDTGLLFLTRAINEWLEDGGFLGMVVSGGYANSAAAAKVWELLYPGKKAALRKLVWLEFSKAMGCKCNSHATNN